MTTNSLPISNADDHAWCELYFFSFVLVLDYYPCNIIPQIDKLIDLQVHYRKNNIYLPLLETGYRPDISLIWPVYDVAIKIVNYVTFNGSDQYCEVAHILFSLCLSCRMKGQILILNSSRNRMVINLL